MPTEPRSDETDGGGPERHDRRFDLVVSWRSSDHRSALGVLLLVVLVAGVVAVIIVLRAL